MQSSAKRPSVSNLGRNAFEFSNENNLTSNASTMLKCVPTKESKTNLTLSGRSENSQLPQFGAFRSDFSAMAEISRQRTMVHATDLKVLSLQQAAEEWKKSHSMY